MSEDISTTEGVEAVERAFGADNRNRLIDQYFTGVPHDVVAPSSAWRHIYRLLLWSDPTTGLAHCYESDKSQPGKPWYSRSLAFHDWLCGELEVSPNALASEIDWLFIKACGDLAIATLRREARQAEIATQQRKAYEGRDFPEPGADPEMAVLIRGGLERFLASEPPSEVWHTVTQKVRQYLAVQNKRKNLVGEGFEDVLAQVVLRACDIPPEQVRTRSSLYEIPGFNRAKLGGKENKVDLAITRPSLRTIVTAKWSVRADREKQFPAEYEEYCNAESDNQKFAYVFVTNEFDPARLMRACDALYKNHPMFDHVVHINTDGLRAAYGDFSAQDARQDVSKGRVLAHIENGRLISLEQWLNKISVQ